MQDVARWSEHSKNLTPMNEENVIYGYFRNGCIYVTPSSNVAWNRYTHHEPFIVVNHEGMRMNPDLFPHD